LYFTRQSSGRFSLAASRAVSWSVFQAAVVLG
jgi:hypothetical protein